MDNQKSIKKQVSVFGFIALTVVLSRVVMYIWHGLTMGSWNYFDFITRLNIYDAGWYAEIANSGYRVSPHGEGQAVWAFFPLFPLFIHLLHRIIPINILALASCVSTVLLTVAMAILYNYIILTRENEKLGKVLVYFYCFGVFTFYASSFYAESLYMLLLVSCYYFMKKEKYILMGICGALLSMTRNTGILFVFAILFYWIQKFCAESSDRSVKAFILCTLDNYKLILGTCLVPFGLFSFMVYLKLAVGDALAFLHVQTAWWRVNSNMLLNLRDALFAEFPPSYLGICAVVIIVLIGILLFKYRRLDEAVMPLLIFVISGNSSLGSVPRYMWGSIFVLVTFAEELVSVNRKYIRVLCYVCTFFLGLIFLNGWFHSHTWLM